MVVRGNTVRHQLSSTCCAEGRDFGPSRRTFGRGILPCTRAHNLRTSSNTPVYTWDTCHGDIYEGSSARGDSRRALHTSVCSGEVLVVFSLPQGTVIFAAPQ